MCYADLNADGRALVDHFLEVDRDCSIAKGLGDRVRAEVLSKERWAIERDCMTYCSTHDIPPNRWQRILADRRAQLMIQRSAR